MNFSITQDDYELMHRFVGGLKYNFKHDPTLNAEGRFTAFVLPTVKDELDAMVTRLDAQIAPPPVPPVTPPNVPGDALFAVAAWGGQSKWLTKDLGEFVNNTFVVKITVPPGSFPVVGKFALAEYGGQQQLREMTVSRFPSDFRDVDPTGANGPIAAGGGVEAVVLFSVGGGGDAVLTPGDWYVNMKNAPSAKDYPAILDITWPHG